MGKDNDISVPFKCFWQNPRKVSGSFITQRFELLETPRNRQPDEIPDQEVIIQ